jgi:hypothetical protein
MALPELSQVKEVLARDFLLVWDCGKILRKLGSYWETRHLDTRIF